MDPAKPFSTEPVTAGTRFACRVEYDGGAFSGWQSQPGEEVTTVQDELESALCEVAAAAVRVHCAGRTDAGVHAWGQIIHFNAPSERSRKGWVVGANANLPQTIRLHWAEPVAGDFHARFSATARRYRYVILNAPVNSALLCTRATWHRRPLDAGAMLSASQSLLGEQDFSAFRAASCQSESPMRCVHRVSVQRVGDFVVIDIEANAFLHHMVRNIAGSLLAVGDGRRDPAWIGQLLAGRDRTLSADTAPPQGLYLSGVDYPSRFALPATPPGPPLVGVGP